MRTLFFTRRVLVGVAAVGVVLLVGAVLGYRLTAGVEVVITNNTGAEIKNLAVEFTGGVVTTPTLKPGATYRATVLPTGESGLKLRFTDAAGEEQLHIIGVYLEPDYRGSILIDLGPHGKMYYQDQSLLPY